MGRKRLKTGLALGCAAAAVVPWLFPSPVVQLVADHRDVLLGRYSVERFSAAVAVTAWLWWSAYGFWSLRRRPAKVVVFRQVALVVAVCLSAVVVDVAARVLLRPVYVEREVMHGTAWPGERVSDVVRHRPPDRHYRIRYADTPPAARSYPSPPPGYPTVDITLTTDRRGFRNQAPLDRCDLVAVGDSFTEGSRVSDEECWPVLLGQVLQRSVYNLGVSGADPGHYRASLEAFGLPLQPRTVVLMLYEGNDFKAPGGSRRLGRRLEMGLKASPVVVGFRAALVRYLGPVNAAGPVRGGAALSWMPVAVPPGPEAKYYAFRPGRLLRLYWTEEAFRQSDGYAALAGILRETQAACQAAGARLVIAYAPSKPHVVMPLVQDRVPPEALHAFAALGARGLPPPDEFAAQLYARLDAQETALAELCRDLGIAFVSLTEALRREAARGRQVYYTYDQHWTAPGHAVVAAELARALTADHSPRPNAQDADGT